jgi:hypothetical protein
VAGGPTVATSAVPTNPIPNWEAVRAEWLRQLGALRDRVEEWAREFDWSTRRVDKPMDDSSLGDYDAPGLVMQKEFTRLLLEPMGWIGPGAEGAVHLYCMPAFDDVASLQLHEGKWWLYRAPPGGPAAGDVLAASKPMTKRALQKLLERLRQHAA